MDGWNACHAIMLQSTGESENDRGSENMQEVQLRSTAKARFIFASLFIFLPSHHH
jgi:hypothetical protein